jgi:hypothetical protein
MKNRQVATSTWFCGNYVEPCLHAIGSASTLILASCDLLCSDSNGTYASCRMDNPTPHADAADMLPW